METFLNLVVMSTLVHYLHADFQVSVELVSYVNTKHILKRGLCCDGFSSTCQDHCDNKFTFCLREKEEGGMYCPDNDTIFETTTSIADDVMFRHGQNIDVGVPNPLIFTGEQWPGIMEFFVRIEDVDMSGDYDASTNDPLVTTFMIPIDFSGSGAEPTLYRDIQSGSNLQLFYQVSCSANLYGENCSIYCLPRDDDGGHYTCDSQGQIQCMTGYQNPLSNCTECSLAPGCYSTGAYCNSTNHCICRERFTGDNCDQCVGGYSGVNCSMCKNNYAGDNCSMCAERYSGTDCSSCIEGYTGENCLECADGFMSSEAKCVKCAYNFAGKNCSVCRVRFVGENCSSCATGFTGANCSICDEGYGGFKCSKCKDGFTGMNCSECATGYVGKDCKKYISKPENINCTTCDGNKRRTNCTDCTDNGYSINCSGGNCSSCNNSSSKCNATEISPSSSPLACAEGVNCTTKCTSGNTTANCSECMDGNDGENCTNSLSPCVLKNGSSPCLNGGICKESNNSSHFHCDCPENFEGHLCEREVKLCVPNPCKNSGTCQILHKNKETTCMCNGEYWGRYCEKGLSEQIDFFYPFIGICGLVCILLLVVIIVIICFVYYCCKKRRNKHLRSVENSLPNGDASGYMISALNPFNSSSELDISGPGLVKITGRKSELFDNPIYDRPSVEIEKSTNSISSNSRQQGECPARNRNALYATKLELSNMDANSIGQNSSSYHERSYDSSHTRPSPCRNKVLDHNYEEIDIMQDKNLKINNSRGKNERSDHNTEDESMLTVVNASYEALPCHMQSIIPKKHQQHNVVLATGQISECESGFDGMSMSLEVPGRKNSGFKPTFNAVEESLTVSSSKPPNQMKSRKS